MKTASFWIFCFLLNKFTTEIHLIINVILKINSIFFSLLRKKFIHCYITYQPIAKRYGMKLLTYLNRFAFRVFYASSESASQVSLNRRNFLFNRLLMWIDLQISAAESSNNGTNQTRFHSTSQVRNSIPAAVSVM